MVFLYLTLVFFVLGICFWIAGSIVNKQKKKFKKSKRKKYARFAETLGTIAKIILILAALSFVMAFILLQGSKTA